MKGKMQLLGIMWHGRIGIVYQYIASKVYKNNPNAKVVDFLVKRSKWHLKVQMGILLNSFNDYSERMLSGRNES